MPIAQSSQLFKLIKSLTSAEKRNFRLYAKRNQGGGGMKFLQLFEVLEKQKELDEQAAIKKLKGVQKSQLPNLKRHLYTQILTSLKLLHNKRKLSIESRDYISYAEILYERGLYLQSLKILEKAMKIAEKEGFEMMKLHIIEKQKLIESRHITRTGPIKNENLITGSKKALREIENKVLLSSLKMKMHSYYLINGHIRNEEEQEKLVSYFEENLPPFELEELDFKAKIYFYQACVWYYYALLDFGKCFESALQWINLFWKDKTLVKWDPDLLMRGYHYLLISAYYNQDKVNFVKHLEDLEHFRKKNYPQFKKNSQIISFLTVHTGRLNRDIILGDFENAVKDSIPRCLRRIKRYGKQVDAHRILVFYYKISWIYLCNNQPKKAIDYLQKILDLETGYLREDLQGYSRIMHLMAHYDLDNYDLLPYLIKTEERFFKRIKENYPLQELSFQFFKKLAKSPLSHQMEAMKDFLSELEKMADDRFHQRALLYLDIPTWILSKITKQSISKLVKQRN